MIVTDWFLLSFSKYNLGGDYVLAHIGRYSYVWGTLYMVHAFVMYLITDKTQIKLNVF